MQHDIQLVSAHTFVTENPQSPGRVLAYVWPVGETIMENFVIGRRNRPYQDWRPLVQEFLVDLGLPEDIKLNWSQRAGCFCGCSPAFIVNRRLEDGSTRRLHPLEIDALKGVNDWRLRRRHELNFVFDVAADDYLEANRLVLT